jgi:hypothetical protein
MRLGVRDGERGGIKFDSPNTGYRTKPDGLVMLEICSSQPINTRSSSMKWPIHVRMSITLSTTTLVCGADTELQRKEFERREFIR